jgi:sulfur carrier protein ThiS
MTVADLIAKLQTMPQEAVVVVNDDRNARLDEVSVVDKLRDWSVHSWELDRERVVSVAVYLA